MTAHTPLGPGAEFDRIRAIWRALGDRMGASGDDCAIVELGGARVALTSDVSVEDVHFRLGWLAPHEIGWRATAAALSDLAAVAAQPAGVLVSLGVPRDWPEEMVADLMAGVGDAAEHAAARVWAGDLVASARVVLDVMAVGTVVTPVRRGGARAGDALWVTGALGGPVAALAAWEARCEPDRAARERFARPVPRIREAQWLGARGARAMIDVSDGLVADARHLAAASGIGWTIDADRVPVHPAAREPRHALTGGEEYELLVALPDGWDDAAAFRGTFGLGLTRIGRAVAGEGVRVVAGGVPVDAPEGFGHF